MHPVSCAQTALLYIYQALLSFWNGFQFSFPAVLSYIGVAVMLRYGLISHHGGAVTPGDLAVASSVIVSFIGEDATMCTVHCAC